MLTLCTIAQFADINLCKVNKVLKIRDCEI